VKVPALPQTGTRIKICGVTTVEQARFIAGLGVESIGVNFVPGSPRRVDEAVAREVVRAVGDQVLVVAVVAGLDVAALRALRDRTGVGCLQLHDDDPTATVEALLPHAYAAVRVASSRDISHAEQAPGQYVMVDAKVGRHVSGSAGAWSKSGEALGGTGHTFDWNLVVDLAKKRKLVLAGGLRPDNVGRAIRLVHPFCVDVASGVEAAPGIKDPERVRAFVDAVRSA
jgi:phosphoribosylanthranilate isomerase